MQAQEVTATRPQRAERHIAVPPNKKRLWREISRNRWSYIYVTPMLILLLAFVVYPIFASLGYTLYQWNGIGDPTAYVGFANFQQVATDPIFWGSFLHTLIFTAVVVPVQLTLALILALVLNNPKMRFTTFYRSVYFLPVVMSAAVVAVVMNLLLSNFGDNIDSFLMKFHIIHEHIDWLADPRFVLWIIIVIQIWYTLGINLVWFLAGLQTIPAELYEAARIDGANGLARLFRITLPMLRSIGLVIIFLSILGNLQVFDLVQVLTGGGPYFASEVVSTYIYQEAFGSYSVGGSGGGGVVQPNVGFASAASFFFGVILLILTGANALAWLYIRRNEAKAKIAAAAAEAKGA